MQGKTLNKIDAANDRIMKQSSVEGNTIQSTIEGIAMQPSAEDRKMKLSIVGSRM